MTARTPLEPDPRSKWLKGLEAISAYLQMSPDEVGNGLRSGEIRGHQRKKGGVWRSHVDWLDAYLAGEEPPSITRRRTA